MTMSTNNTNTAQPLIVEYGNGSISIPFFAKITAKKSQQDAEQAKVNEENGRRTLRDEAFAIVTAGRDLQSK